MIRSLLIVLVLSLTCTSVHAAADIQKSLAVVFGHEGGLQCDRDDPGNWTGGKVDSGRQGCTKFGIATNTYPLVDIRNLSLAQASQLYKRDFWDPLRLYELESQALAIEIFDTSVNCGVGTGGNMVLQLVNIFGPAHYPLNGRVNAEQIEWINQYTRKTSNRTSFWRALNVLQGARYLAIIQKNPRMMKYCNSWFSRVGEQ